MKDLSDLSNLLGVMAARARRFLVIVSKLAGTLNSPSRQHSERV